MQLKTILNRIQKFKSFVYGSIRWVEEAKEPTIEVELHLVPTADRSVLNVAAKDPVTTGCRFEDSSLSRHGASRCFSLCTTPG